MPEMTKEQLRNVVKRAFYAGFAAARSADVSNEWDESSVRKDIDYGKLYEHLTAPSSETPA